MEINLDQLSAVIGTLVVFLLIIYISGLLCFRTAEVLLHGPFPFSWAELSDEENKRIKGAINKSPFNDMIRYSEDVVLPRTFQNIADRLYNFPVKEDDIWIVTYPKCGTTWTQEMVWQIVNGVDMEGGKMPLFTRSPFIEVGCIPFNPFKPSNLAAAFRSFWQPSTTIKGMLALAKHMADPMEYAKTLAGRRVIKCHLPVDFLPQEVLEKCKIVYVARNPKDCAVSYFHHCRLLHGWVADFDEFIKQFEENLALYGSYWHHILGGWQYKHHQNFTFIWFEEMKKDQKSVIQRMCQFLDQPLSQDKVDELVESLKFENMKQNQSVNMDAVTDKNKGEFMRKGIVGDWKAHFDEETDQRWDEWIKKNIEGKNIIIPGK